MSMERTAGIDQNLTVVSGVSKQLLFND